MTIRGRKALCDICGMACAARELRPLLEATGQPSGNLACKRCYERPNPQLAPSKIIINDPKPVKGPIKPETANLVIVGQTFDQWFALTYGGEEVPSSPPPPPPPPPLVEGAWTTDGGEEFKINATTEAWEYQFVDEPPSPPPPPPPPPSPYNAGLLLDSGDYLLVAPATALSWGGNVPDQSTPPVANNDTASTTPNTPVGIDVLANDTDPKGGPLFIVNPIAGEDDVSPDSASKFGQIVIYSPPQGFSGTDTFEYTIEDVAGNQATATVTVTVAGEAASPVADFVGSPISGASPLEVTFVDRSQNATSWLWEFGDGTTSTLQNPVKTYSTAGNFTVKLTARNSGGSDSLTRSSYISTVVAPVPVAPVADFVGGPVSGLTPLTVSFVDQSTNTPTSWLWNFGDATTSTLRNPSKVYAANGTYTVTLTATNAAGSNTKTRTDYITTRDTLPDVAAQFTASVTSGNVPLTVQFTNQSVGATTYLWNFGDGATSAQVNPSKTYSNAGTYTVTLTANGPAGSNTVTKTGYITVRSGGQPAPPASSVLKQYRMIGHPGFGGTQGDNSDDNGVWYRFKAAKTGKLKYLFWQSQGARPNAEWGDQHAGGNYGKYNWFLYRTTAAPVGNIGTAAQRGNPIAQTKEVFYPGRRVGGFDGYVTKPADSGTQSGGTNQIVGGGIIHAFGNEVIDAQYASGVSSGAPLGWIGSRRYYGQLYVYVPLYDANGNLGVDVTVGDILLAQYKNEDSAPSTNYSHDNALHSKQAPVPGQDGIDTPLDPVLGLFRSNGNRDFRKIPNFGMQIDDVWFGQPYCIRDGVNKVDDTAGIAEAVGASNGCARLMYGTRQARQVLTPPDGYTETVNKLWVHAVRFTGKTNYTTSGRLQVRIRRATFTTGTPTFSDYWPSSGWYTFSASAFGASNKVVHDGSGEGQLSADQIMTYGAASIDPAITISGEYHYAIELRVHPDDTATAYYIAAIMSASERLNRLNPSGTVALNWPTIWPHGSSGRSYNRAEKTDNAWSSFAGFRDNNSRHTFPISLEPVN